MKIKSEKRKIGVSVLNYSATTNPFRGLKYLIKKAVFRDKADGLQVPPIWWWSKANLEKYSHYIIAHKHAPSFGLTKKQAKERSKRCYYLNYISDLIFFLSVLGNFSRAQSLINHLERECPKSIAINTGGCDSLLDVSPEKVNSLKSSERDRYTLNSFHILEQSKSVTDALDTTELYKPTARCIQLKWSKSPLSTDMLRELFMEKGYLYCFLQIALKHTDFPIIIEISELDLKMIGQRTKDVVALIRKIDSTVNYVETVQFSIEANVLAVV